MTDPYKILGVNPSASDNEIKKAYRKLAKKYHPDLNPGDKSAEKKMHEINAAYEMICNQKRGGGSYGQSYGSNTYGNGQYGGRGAYGSQQSGSRQNGSGNYGGSWGDPYGSFDFEELFRKSRQWQQQQQRGSGSSKMQAVYNFIAHRRYNEALHVLSEITERDAEWYYYSALANAGAGNRVSALNNAREAVKREPDNIEYRNLLNRFEKGIFEYYQAGQSFDFDMGKAGKVIFRLCIAQAVCSICCRPYYC